MPLARYLRVKAYDSVLGIFRWIYLEQWFCYCKSLKF